MEVGRERRREAERWANFGDEIKKVIALAGPMVVVAVLQYMVQMVTIVMVGHIDQLSLASVAIATSLTNVTGFSLLSGLVGGLETLCGQAYGAKEYNKIGIYTCSAIISLLLVCIPVSISWIFLDKFLILIGQDPLISLEARKYSIYLIPALFGGAIVKPIMRSLQSQSLTIPLLVSCTLVLCFHVPVCWALVFKLKLGIVGAAVAFSLSNWLYLILVVLYVKFSPLGKNTHVTISMDAFAGIKEFFRFAVPSAVMICLKWWALEILILISGLLPNPELETSVLSICLTISTLHFTISYGVGAAASCRQFLGKVYSNEKPVVSYVASMAPFISLSIITESLQAVISGIAKGSGWQHIGAYVNLGAFYLFGIPAAVVLGFPLHLRAKGFWIGIVIGSVILSIGLLVITGRTDWGKQNLKSPRLGRILWGIQIIALALPGLMMSMGERTVGYKSVKDEQVFKLNDEDEVKEEEQPSTKAVVEPYRPPPFRQLMEVNDQNSDMGEVVLPSNARNNVVNVPMISPFIGFTDSDTDEGDVIDEGELRY
ncbi:MATE efflux family protein [Artemisia annua]|uniref:Protein DETOXIFICATION n=1 Tax=Artemisia annua TaxID=35608 RepID=A0A2U1Q049_ARTAN|nr:MATE efflux family protein [Artemisia annua]